MNAENALGNQGKKPDSTWAGDIGESGHSMPCVVHLTDEHLFLNFAYWSKFDRDEAVRNLQSGQPPSSVFGKGTAVFTLAEINELRLCDALNLLEIYHGPSHQRYEIQSELDPVQSWLYSALRERLAPGVIPKIGSVSSSGAISGPLWGLGLALVLGGLLVFWATDARPDRVHTGRGAYLKGLIETFLFQLGVTGAAIITACVILVFIFWIWTRWRNPPVAEVIKIARPKEGPAGG